MFMSACEYDIYVCAVEIIHTLNYVKTWLRLILNQGIPIANQTGKVLRRPHGVVLFARCPILIISSGHVD